MKVERAVAFRLSQNFITEESNLKIETCSHILYMLHMLLNNPLRGLLNSRYAHVFEVVLLIDASLIPAVL